MSNVKLFSKREQKNTHVKKSGNMFPSLSKNKSPGSAKLGGPEPETTWNRVTEGESKQMLWMQQRWNQTLGSKNQLQVSDAHLNNLHKITACAHAEVYVCCCCPGFTSTQRGIRLLWSTCRDLCLIICWLVLDPEHPKPLEITKN